MEFFNVQRVSNPYGIASVEEAHQYSNDFPYIFDVDIVLIIRNPKLSKPLVAICEKWDETPNFNDPMVYFHIVGNLNSITFSSRFLTLAGGNDILFKYLLDGLPNLSLDLGKKRGEKIPLRHKTIKEALHTHHLFKKSEFVIVGRAPLDENKPKTHLFKQQIPKTELKTSFYKFKENLAFRPELPYQVKIKS